MNITRTAEGWEVKDSFDNYLGDIYPSQIEGYDAVKESGEVKNFMDFQDAAGFFRKVLN